MSKSLSLVICSLFVCISAYAQYYGQQIYQQPKNDHARKPTSSLGIENNSDGCSEYDPVKDQEMISKYQAEIKKIEGLKGNSEAYQKTVSEIAGKYIHQISPEGRQSLLANHYRAQLDALSSGLRKNSDLAKSYKDFEAVLQKHDSARDEYSDTGFVGREFRDADGKFRRVGNETSYALNRLLAKLEASDLPALVKKNIRSSLVKSTSATFAQDAASAARASDRYERYAAGAKLTRDVSAGSALIIGGILTGGATASAGAAVLGATGSSAAVLLAGSATMGVAGAAGGAGYGLLRGNASQVGNAMLSDEKFFCALAREQAASSDQVYKDALIFATIGGAAGAAFGLGLAVGGATATVTIASGTGLGVLGGGATLWEGSSAGIESYRLYEKAHEATDAGNEEEARRLLKEARAKAVDAGLSGVDTVFAGVGSHQGFRAFRNALKSAPQSLNQISKQTLAQKNQLHESFDPMDENASAEVLFFDAHNRAANPAKIQKQFEADFKEGGNMILVGDVHRGSRNGADKIEESWVSYLGFLRKNKDAIGEVVSAGDIVDQAAGNTAKRIQMTIDSHREMGRAIGVDARGKPKRITVALGNHDEFRLEEVRLLSGEIVPIPRGKITANMSAFERERILSAADSFYRANGFDPAAMRSTNKSGEIIFKDPVARRDLVKGLTDLRKEGINIEVKGVNADDLVDLGGGVVLSHYALASGSNVNQAIQHAPRQGISLPAGTRTYIAGDQHSAYAIQGGKNWNDGGKLDFFGMGALSEGRQAGNVPSVLMVSPKGRGYFVGLENGAPVRPLTNFTQIRHQTVVKPEGQASPGLR